MEVGGVELAWVVGVNGADACASRLERDVLGISGRMVGNISW